MENENREYIDSGILEMYVYGLLTEKENEEIANKAKVTPAINEEIIAIEKAIIALSSSFSPFHSVANYEKIKAKLELKHADVIELQPRSNVAQYLGWAAAILLLVGIGYQYNEINVTNNQVALTEVQKTKLEQENKALQLQNATLSLIHI